MVYPYCPEISVTDFVKRLAAEYSVVQKKCDTQVHYPDGKTHSVIYLERTQNGKTCRRHFEVASVSDSISATVLRSVCAGLDVEPSAFGFEWKQEPVQ